MPSSSSRFAGWSAWLFVFLPKSWKLLTAGINGLKSWASQTNWHFYSKVPIDNHKRTFKSTSFAPFGHDRFCQ
jgi:hypothetical protein